MRLFEFEDQPQIGDILEIELGEEIVEAVITGFDGDEITAETDSLSGGTLLAESYGKYWCSTDKKWKERQGPKQHRKTHEGLENPKDNPCWDGYHPVGTKKKNGKTVPNCVPESANPAQQAAIAIAKKEKEKTNEAEYQGRTVKLGKPMQGDVKKFKVYVRNPKTGKTVKVNFGDPNMRIKKSNPKRRKSFRARHNCANPGPRTKARYWSCRKW
jgi:hypothetical protein